MSRSAPIILRPDVFTALSDVVGGFSLRRGGVSPPPYDTLNLGLSTGDADAHVLENRRRLFETVGCFTNQLAIAGQVHGAEVNAVTAPGLYPGCDALVTRTLGVVLCISAADCAAVLLADPERRVIGACHAGWRGAVAGVVKNTVAAMEKLGAVPARMCAYVSPCISMEHFEVGPEVAAQFKSRFVQQRSRQARPHVDLKAAIAAQLQAAGIASDAIDVSAHCTFAETDKFFSYRAEEGVTGRMMGFLTVAT